MEHKRPQAKLSKLTVKPDGRKRVGQLGEAAACEYLEQSGYVILARNWRCRTGEIDIVAAHGGVTVFVEVRTRRSGGRFGTAAESIDFRKRRQVMETARVYLKLHAAEDVPVRFDAVAITMDGDQVVELKHYEGAL